MSRDVLAWRHLLYIAILIYSTSTTGEASVPEERLALSVAASFRHSLLPLAHGKARQMVLRWLLPAVCNGSASGVLSVAQSGARASGAFRDAFRAVVAATEADADANEILLSAWKMADAEAEVQRVRWTCELLSKVYTAGEGEKLRAAASEAATQIVSSVEQHCSAPKKEAEALLGACKKVREVCQERASAEMVRDGVAAADLNALDHTFAQWERKLSQVPDGCDRERLSAVEAEVASLRAQFCAAVARDNSSVSLPVSALAGMDETFIAGLSRDPDNENAVIVTAKYPDVYPILRTCTVAESREAVLRMFYNRAPGNTATFRKLLLLLQERASLLGHASHVHSVLADNRMAKTPETVKEFLDDLVSRVAAKAKEDRETLAEVIAKEANGRTMQPWDVSYATEKFKKETFDLDTEALRAFFPLDHVLTVVLEHYQRIFGLEFVRLQVAAGDAFDPATEISLEGEAEKDQKFLAWHESVYVYRVYDEAADGEEKQPCGYFLLDLFPRPGKYSHACAYPVVDGILKRGTEKEWQQEPVSVMVANLPASGGLRTSDVKTLFHEMGHVMHGLCARARTWSQSWFNVPLDFVEAPSQALEDFAWDRTFLRKLTKHNETGEPLDDATIDRLVTSRHALGSLGLLRQLGSTIFDQRIHSSAALDPFVTFAGLDASSPPASPAPESLLSRAFEKQQEETSGLPELEANYVAGWLHMGTSEYSGSYYGYIYSEVLSAEIYAAMAEGGVEPETGASESMVRAARRYRHLVLAPGASQPPDRMLEEFLGRKPSNAAFLASRGLGDA